MRKSYQYIGNFYEGRAKVESKGKFGFIDENKNLVIDCIFDYACDFQEGRVSVESNGKWGSIDLNGHQAVIFIYMYAFHFHKNLHRYAYVETRNGGYGDIDAYGFILPYK